MARDELRPGDLMSFMVASQTIQRFVLFHFLAFEWKENKCLHCVMCHLSATNHAFLDHHHFNVTY